MAFSELNRTITCSLEGMKRFHTDEINALLKGVSLGISTCVLREISIDTPRFSRRGLQDLAAMKPIMKNIYLITSS
jgi:hypothetical protein